ncbi:MAG: hypothetical protein ACRYFS_06825 [Janthinobacterium lividum]
MRKSRASLLILVSAAATGVFLARSGAVLHAQSSAPAATQTDTPQSVDVHFGLVQWLSAPHSADMSQGVKFTQEDATLQTEAAVALFDKDDALVSAKAAGSVHIYDTQDDLVGQHGSVNFTKHIATLQDGIVFIVKPGKREANAASGSPRKQFKDPATLTCQGMTYDYRNKIGRIPGPLTVVQAFQTKDGPETRTLTADAGLYNGKAETIQLVGDIKGTLSDGSVIQGDTRLKGKPVVIIIKEGSEAIYIPFPTQGHFFVKPDSESGTDKDDEPDLTLPVPPPHTPSAADTPTSISPAAPAQTSPIPGKTVPNQTPPTPTQTPPATAPAGTP